MVGIHGHGASHVRKVADLQERGLATLTALVDPRPLDGDVPWYPDLDTLLAEARPDVVVIATPIHTHLALASAALRAGCDVLLEKPTTASLAEHAELLAVVEETGRLCQVGFQTFGSGAVDEVARIVATGELGEITGVGAVGTWVRTAAYYERARWAGRRTLDGVEVVDGVVTNPLAHAIATALLLAGARTAEDVTDVRLDLHRAHPIEADDTSAVVVETRGGDPRRRRPDPLRARAVAGARHRPRDAGHRDPALRDRRARGVVAARHASDPVRPGGPADPAAHRARPPARHPAVLGRGHRRVPARARGRADRPGPDARAGRVRRVGRRGRRPAPRDRRRRGLVRARRRRGRDVHRARRPVRAWALDRRRVGPRLGSFVVILRDYRESDGPATLDVFLRAIRVTAARDYTPEQVAAWASDEIDPAGWAARRRAARTRGRGGRRPRGRVHGRRRARVRRHALRRSGVRPARGGDGAAGLGGDHRAGARAPSS